MNAVVGATRHLLDHCRPRSSGVAVVGRIDPPSGDAAPMPVSCTVTLRREGAFYLAQVLIVAPPKLPGVHVDETYEVLTGPDIQRNNEQIAWRFIVTHDGAMSIDSAQGGYYESGGTAPTWTWTGSRWKGPARERCGGSGGEQDSGGPQYLDFVSACGR
jgi:hypothetical protein